MMKVVIDSNIFCRDFHLRGTTFRVFLSGLSTAGHSICIPKLVIDEVQNKYEEQLKEWEEIIDGRLSDMRRLTGKPLEFHELRGHIELAVREYNEEFTGQIRKAGADFPEYPTVPHQEIVKRSLSRIRPFSEDDRGYRDSLIWETVLLIARDSADEVAFVTNDYKAFYDDKKERLHPDLVVDMEARTLPPGRIILFDKLDKFVSAHIRPHLKALELVRDAILQDKYGQLDIRRLVREELPDLLRGMIGQDPLDRILFGLPPNAADVTLSSVEDPQLKKVDVHRLSPGTLLVEVTIGARCRFDFSLFSGTYAVPSGTSMPPTGAYYIPSGTVMPPIGTSMPPTRPYYMPRATMIPLNVGYYGYPSGTTISDVMPPERQSKTKCIEVVLNITFDEKTNAVTSKEIKSISSEIP